MERGLLKAGSQLRVSPSLPSPGWRSIPRRHRCLPPYFAAVHLPASLSGAPGVSFSTLEVETPLGAVVGIR